MRTHLVMDNQLLPEAQRVTGLTTPKATIDEALRWLIRLKQ